MTREQGIEALIAAYLADGPTELPLERLDAIAAATEELSQNRRWPASPALSASPWLRAAAVAAAIVLASALIAQRLTAPRVGSERPGPTPVPSSLSWTPGPLPSSLTWTPGAVNAPYPAPFRGEQAAAAQVLPGAPVSPEPLGGWPVLRWLDGHGDGLPASDPRVDLAVVDYIRWDGCLRSTTLCIFFQPAQLLERPLPRPNDEWLAYGVVLDADGDGVPDRRFAIDNAPGLDDRHGERAWFTDLRTGRTEVIVGGQHATIDGSYGEAEFPMASGTTRPGFGYMWLQSAADDRFYVWAALIRDGEIVSLDFAPDTGWLVAPNR